MRNCSLRAIFPFVAFFSKEVSLQDEVEILQVKKKRRTVNYSSLVSKEIC